MDNDNMFRKVTLTVAGEHNGIVIKTLDSYRARNMCTYSPGSGDLTKGGGSFILRNISYANFGQMQYDLKKAGVNGIHLNYD